MTDDASPPASDPGASRTPARIGPYRLLDTLGEGGMGTVYLAEQDEPVRRRVALKLIKLGMDSKAVLARFEQERQALALMQHDGIAKVHDCGTSERGQPYFVMEYVRGVPLTEYCERHRLPLPARLELMMQVCAAVQHAHHKGVVHRDLKPGNVLVADDGGRPQIKIIDFGLAKAMGQRLVEATLFTEAGQVVGTPEYMAPEQADPGNHDIDTRADVYSIGVMLYEVLVGALPFSGQELRRAGVLELQRVLREVDPPRPSSRLSRGGDAAAVAGARRTTLAALQRALRTDLDWVVLKALEKDRGRRYETASALAADLQRFLANEPLAAGPPSASYRLRKLVARHRAQLLAVAAVLLTALAGAGVAIGFALRAEQQRQLATARATETEAALAVAEGHRLALQSTQALATDAGLATVLAVEAGRHHEDAITRSAMVAALARHGQETRSLHGHAGTVDLVALAPRGPLGLTGGRVRPGLPIDRRPGARPEDRLPLHGDGTVRVWNVETGTPQAVLPLHPEGVESFGFDATGTRCWTCTEHGVVRTFDARDGRELRRLPPPPGSLTFRFVDADLATAVFEVAGRLVALDLQSGREVASADGTSMVPAPDRRHVLWPGPEGWVVHEVPAWRPVAGLRVVRPWCLSDGARWVLADDGEPSTEGSPGAPTKTLAVIEAGSGRRVATVTSAVAFEPEGAVLSADGTCLLVREQVDGKQRFSVWDLATAKRVASVDLMQGGISGSGDVLAVHDGGIDVVATRSQQVLAMLSVVSPYSTAAAVRDDGSTVTVLTGSPVGVPRVWTLPRARWLTGSEQARAPDGTRRVAFSPRSELTDALGRRIAPLQVGRAIVEQACFDPTGRRAAMRFDGENELRWFDVASGDVLWQRPHGGGYLDRPIHATWTPDGGLFLVVTPGRLEAWHGEQPGMLLWSAALPTDRAFYDCAIAADGSALALWPSPELAFDGTLRHHGVLVDLADGIALEQRIVHRALVGLSSCGRSLAVGRGAGFAVLDRDSGRELLAADEPVEDVQIGVGAWAVVTRRRAVRVFVPGGAPFPTSPGPAPRVLSAVVASLSPDGTRLVHADQRQAWVRGATAPAAHELGGLGAAVVHCLWSPDSDRLAVWTADDRVHVFRGEPLQRIGGGASPGSSQLSLTPRPVALGLGTRNAAASWSADGGTLVWVAPGGICVWSEPTPHDVALVPTDHGAARCAVSADGALAAVEHADVGGATLLALGPAGAGLRTAAGAIWFAPRGPGVVLQAASTKPRRTGRFVLDPDARQRVAEGGYWVHAATGTVTRPVEAPGRPVRAASFSPAGTVCLLEASRWEYAFAAPRLRLIRAADGQSIADVPGRTALGWTDDGRWLLTGGRGADAVHCIDAGTGDVLGRIAERDAYVELLPSGERALVVGTGSRANAFAARLCTLPDLSVVATLPELPQIPASLAVVAQPGWLALLGDNESNVRLFDLQTGELVRELMQSESATCLAADRDGRVVAVGSGSGRVQVFDATTGAVRLRLSLPEEPIRDLAVTPDGSLLAALTESSQLFVHRTSDGGRHWHLVHSGAWGGPASPRKTDQQRLRFSADGSMLRRGALEWPVHPLDAATQRRPRVPTLAEVRHHGLHTPARHRPAVDAVRGGEVPADAIVDEYAARERALDGEAGVLTAAREVVERLAVRWIDPVQVRLEIGRLALPDAVRDAALAESLTLRGDAGHIAEQVARVLAARPRDGELDRHALALAERLQDQELIALGLLRVGDVPALRERMQSKVERISAAGSAAEPYFRQIVCVLLAHAFAGDWAEVERLVASQREEVGPQWWRTIERVCGGAVRREVEQRGPLDEASLASWVPSPALSPAEQHDARVVARLLVAAWSRTDSLNSVAWRMVVEPDGDADRYRRGLQLAEAAVRSNPRPHVRNTLGVALYRCGRYAEAIDTLLHTGAGAMALLAAAWQPDGSSWWTAGRDRVLRRCTETECTEVVALHAGAAEVRCLAVVDEVVWAGTSGGLLLRVEEGAAREVARTAQAIHQVLPLAGGAEIAVAHGPEVTIVAAATGATRRPMAAGAGPLRLATDGTGTLLLVGDQEGRAVVATLTPEAPRAAVSAGGPLLGVHLAQQATSLVTVRADGEVAGWGGPDWTRLRHFRVASHDLRGFAVTADASVFAFGTAAGAVELWHGPDPRRLGERTGHRGRVTALAFRPDGTRLVSTSEDGTARLWDVASLAPLPCPHPSPSLAARDVTDLVFLAMAWHRLGERERAAEALAELRRRPQPDDPEHEQRRLLAEAEQVLRD